jgi:5-methylcytosine-specific restriction endonuclease McrA
MRGKAASWQSRKEWTVAYYHRKRQELINEMGGKCTQCGLLFDLEFHHLKSRSWVANRSSRWVRLARYRREWRRGEIILLCHQCNLSAGRPDY